MQSYVRSIWEECLNMISCLRLISSIALEHIGAGFVPKSNPIAYLPLQQSFILSYLGKSLHVVIIICVSIKIISKGRQPTTYINDFQPNSIH
jgi:putative exporter of polyketide antibiotics